MPAIALGTTDLKLGDYVALSRPGAQARLPRDVRQKVAQSRQVVDRALEDGNSVYGVNTGFGKLSGVTIPEAKLADLQRNLLLSHATGVGQSLPREFAQLAFALRIHNLARGFSGVRVELLDLMLALFNAGLIPEIPRQGSVGASGDLAPLAHMALPLIGRGEVHDGKRKLSGKTALQRIGRPVFQLHAKEGLALINGTQIMTAIGVLTVARAEALSRVADVACATTVEALRASAQPFLASVHELRAHPGQVATARNLRSLLRGSKILPSHKGCDKVQDAYSLRCAPQVHGVVKEAVGMAKRVTLIEAGAVTDNPLVFPDGKIVSAGNFHGQPVSQAMDVLGIGLATAANISERRTENLVNPDISGLPAFLAPDPGIESGFMIQQVVAAALASENKVLAHPSSVDTIPTSANREDHVSMGVTAARHAWRILRNTERVLAIELLCGAQGLDCGEPLRPGRGVEAAYKCIRDSVPTLSKDRFMAPDIAKADDLLVSGSLLAQVEEVTGPLAGSSP